MGFQNVRVIKAARAVVVAVFSLAVALTPLSSTFSHSRHEAWFPDWDGYGRPHVVLDDRTGLVSAMNSVALAPERNSRDDRLLVVSWLGGCSEQEIHLTLDVADDGYRMSKIETENGCPFLVGLERNLALTLRWPLDASTVQFDALGGSVT